MAQASLRREALTCLICGELLKDPATLPCGHSFCLDCIQRQWDLQTSCSCPMCSDSFSPRPPLSKNTVLAKLMAGLRAPPADDPEDESCNFNVQSWVLIDRSGKHFGSILQFLQEGAVLLPKNTQALMELMNEAKYYRLQELVLLCHSTLQKERPEQPLCAVPLVTSRKEEEWLISSSTKPVVKLVYNRSNNKYSYTSNSDDNLLKNIELFERLSLSFSCRVLFIKNVIGDEICCWSFYGQRRKLSEVCCTSIVYSTEKKHTKVEFPEARIYEETLNALLYETVPLPDHSLLEATRRRYNHCGTHSEEEEGPGPGLALL